MFQTNNKTLDTKGAEGKGSERGGWWKMWLLFIFLLFFMFRCFWEISFNIQNIQQTDKHTIKKATYKKKKKKKKNYIIVKRYKS